MTALSQELARKRPAEIVVTDGVTSTDFGRKFPLVRYAHAEVAAFFEVERERFAAGDARRAPGPTAGELMFLRVGAALLIAFALVGLAVASIRTF